MNIDYTIAETFLGEVVVAETEKGICAVVFGCEPDILYVYFPDAEIRQVSIKTGKYFAAVISCINNPFKKHKIPLLVEGTEFQKKVWKAIEKIPAGKTVSYKDIAIKIGKPGAYRAVANACGANIIPVLIPCHRVVASEGKIGGYSGGLDIKRKLLAAEESYF